MTADECDAMIREALAPLGVTVTRQDAAPPLVYAARAERDERHWHFVVMPKDGPDFVRLMLRNAAVAFNRGIAPRAA